MDPSSTSVHFLVHRFTTDVEELDEQAFARLIAGDAEFVASLCALDGLEGSLVIIIRERTRVHNVARGRVGLFGAARRDHERRIDRLRRAVPIGCYLSPSKYGTRAMKPPATSRLDPRERLNRDVQKVHEEELATLKQTYEPGDRRR